MGPLALLMSRGFTREDALASLYLIFVGIDPHAPEEEKELARLGVTARRDIDAVGAELRVAFEGFTDEQMDGSLAQIFGQYAVRAARVLFRVRPLEEVR